MSIAFGLDLISFVLLIGAFIFLWREKKHFYSIKPILPAFIFLSIGRLCDMSLEHPTFRLSNVFGLSPYPFELAFAIIGNITDVIGFCLLIYGFVKIVKHKQHADKHIRDLETLLPICANCKKYRDDNGNWVPIEKYLTENGSAIVSHAMCPDCIDLFYPEYVARLQKKRG
ncbi:MAG TPA: hypothetical protein VMM58_02725 [Bacteroidota bacterium]|nr:hypothetical protein [Bacteroidota bacterium]